MSRKQYLMNNVAICLVMSEQRQFLGPKSDGFVYLPNKEALDKFHAHISAHRSYDSYAQIDECKLVALDDAGIVALAEAIDDAQDRPWLWTETDHELKLW